MDVPVEDAPWSLLPRLAGACGGLPDGEEYTPPTDGVRDELPLDAEEWGLESS